MCPETGKVIDITGLNERPGANIIVYANWKGWNQKWIPVQRIFISNEKALGVLSVKDNKTDNGTAVVLQHANASGAQIWGLVTMETKPD